MHPFFELVSCCRFSLPGLILARAVALSLSLLLLSPEAQATAHLTGPTDYSILQGATSSTESSITIVAPVTDLASVRIVRDPSNPSIEPTFTVSRTTQHHSDYEVVRVDLSSLVPGQVYRIQVFDQTGRLRDEREFSTMKSNSGSVRIVVGSCMNDHLHNPWIWQTIAQRAPDLVLITGDTAYLDQVSLFKWRKPDSKNQIWDRHIEARNRIGLYRWKRLRPTVAVFDDHDFGFNNAQAKDNPLADHAREAFATFFSRSDMPGVLSSGPGLSFHLRYGDVDLIALDGRSFRDHSKPYSFFGVQQEEWIKTRLTGPNAPRAAFLATGSQFFGKYLKKDSYEYHSESDLKRFARSLSASATKLTLLSGDIHFSEIMAIESKWLGYRTLEATVSSLHSGTIPGRHKLDELRGIQNPRRIAATSTHNFAEITASTRPDFTDVQIDLVTWRGQTKSQLQLTHSHRPQGWACLQQVGTQAL